MHQTDKRRSSLWCKTVDIDSSIRDNLLLQSTARGNARHVLIRRLPKRFATMACLLLNQENVHIKIPSADTIDGITYYCIEVRIASIKWTVKHRWAFLIHLFWHSVLFLYFAVSLNFHYVPNLIVSIVLLFI